MDKQIKVGIIGGAGYTGGELIRILLYHPSVDIIFVNSKSNAGNYFHQVHNDLLGETDLKFSGEFTNDIDVLFLCLGHGESKKFLADNPITDTVKIIDLANDFRLVSGSVAGNRRFTYGLPELNRAAIKSARVIGNPGCYPTTMQLGFAPLLKAGIVDAGNLIADCKSGVSGAGRKAEIGILFSESSDSFKAYGVSGHRHTPETIEQLQHMTSEKIGLLFTPHLVPMIRGMHATLYARLNKEVSNEELQALFENAYKDEPFVDVMPFGAHPETRSTRGSNMLRLALHRPQNGNTVVVLVVQDNLVKGSSGQAVQCMNLMFGLDETTGLMHVPVMP